ncbi:hypothetical protein T439DRAFT_323736 [Meredithblackwellia eburnea MCA 4105]
MSRKLPPSVSQDIRQFLAGYPGRSASTRPATANLDFYQNKGPARPSPHNHSQLIASLAKNYDELEYNHSFIQWLFPIREMGVNFASQPLELAERDAIKQDLVAMDRLLQSYELMLDFYGLRLVSFKTGQVARSETLAPSPQSWKVRYQNLERNMHNFLRITRILKCNSEFGREHLNAGWLLWFLLEQARGELDSTSLTRSMDGYWRYCIREDAERDWVLNKVDEVRNGGMWTEEDYLAALKRREETGSF